MIISPKYDYFVKEMFHDEIVLRYFIGNILGIPQDEIRTVRLKNTFLWKRHKKQKLGILDVLAELNNDTKIDIELQAKVCDSWDKRQLFYLAKLYTEDLQMGEDYSRLRKCVGIGILNFNMSDREEYHSVYHLRDKEGHKLSDMLEVHVLELKKKLTGHGDVDNWIRFFNAKTEEDLKMIKTKNMGILKAIGLLERMSMSNRLRLRYEAYLKDMRDERAIKIHMWKEARAQGRAQGRAEGRAEGQVEGRAQGRAEGQAEGRAQGRAEGLAEGVVQGKREDILEVLEMRGEVPEDLRARICLEKNTDQLRKWLRLAEKSGTVEEFQEKMNISL